MATNNYRSSVVSLALSYVNVIGGKAKGDDAFISYYNQVAGTNFDVDNTPWCAIFVTYCLRHAGVPLDICPNFAGCNHLKMKFLEPKGLWKSRDAYTPEPGDLVFFSWDKYIDFVDHVAIVEKVENTKLYVIIGNSNNGVRHKAYPINSEYIAGYGALEYDEPSALSKPVATETPTAEAAQRDAVAQASKKAAESIKQVVKKTAPRLTLYATYVKTFQTWLNKTYKLNVIVSGICDARTKKATVKALQTHLNTTYGTKLKVDGRFGPDTMDAVREYATLYPGAKGNMVYMVQGLLYGAGYSAGGFDGSYGTMMKPAVNMFKMRNTLTTDGVVEANTWSCLVR